ncbi:MAG: hypothetical protein GXP10_08175 [Gammaproteobacteria bacterium]|nr:hypothetical protein [Gammaproteobacteria bacterium]
MKKRRILAIAAVAVSPLLLAGAANAATPAFDDWSVVGGNIVTGSGDWSTGTDIVADTGFLQTQMTDSTGQTYIRQVIAEGFPGGPDVAFSDESIIRVNFSQNPTLDVNNGIALKSIVNDFSSAIPGFAFDFDSVAVIKTGWATASGGDNDSEVRLENTYVVGDAWDSVNEVVTGQNFSFGFVVDQYDDNGDGAFDGKALALTQGVALQDSTALEVAGSGDNTLFALQELSGDRSNGGMIRGLNTGADLGATAGYSPTVAWAAGETIKVFGIGQQIDLGATSGGASASFGHVQAENLTTGDIGFASAGGGQAEANETLIGLNGAGNNPGLALSSWEADADFSTFENPFVETTAPAGSTPLPQLFLNP